MGVTSGANALVRSPAVDLAPHGISVNAIAPSLLYSEAYYPNAVFEKTEAGCVYVAANVPTGRLADPSEIGALIAFLATAKSRHITGAVIDFACGWPFGPERPEPD